ncbi:glycosyltransferase family 4 protein [Methylocystis echinoides]|nr:glycosyltransferase family 4 protein [Methylocystis echinoides]
MRLLALLTDGFGAGGGIGQYNRDLMTAVAQAQAIEKIVVLPRFGDRSVALPDKVEQANAEPRAANWCLRSLQLAVTQQFDVVLCGHLNAMPFATMLARAIGARLWLQVHGIEAWEQRGAIARASLRRAHLVTSVSRYTRRRLLAWSDLAPERVRVLPNTFSTTFTARVRRRDLVERFGLDGKRVIMTVGRLATRERYKGHDRIIRALPVITAKVPDVVYVIAGSGDDEPRLRAIAEQSGVSTRVVFTGQVPQADIADYFALADVFAMPSLGEGFGIAFLEAAATGLPVIGGNSDGSADALADGQIGHLIDPKSQDELVEASIGALEKRWAGNPTTVLRFKFANFARHVSDLVEGQLAS